ncbi:MAG: TPM domain-containing protein [Bacilli bacterium]|nr:TPM domain-containing protein [Bacilli bacterium]
MKKIFVLLISLFLLVLPVYASTNTYSRTTTDLKVPKKIKYKSSMEHNVLLTPSVNANEKIYDFAELLTEEEEKQLYDKVKEFIANTNLDLAIVTINTNVKDSTQEYADDFYDYNDFSIDGLAFVIDMQNRIFYISTAGKAMLYYDDYRIEYILSALDQEMYNHEYFNACNTLISQLTEYYNNGFSDNADKYVVIGTQIYRKTPYLLLSIIAVVSATIGTLILALRNKKIKLATNSNDYFDNKSFEITKDTKEFISSNTSRVYIPPADSGGGGSSGGGFHSGSSGASHGGGGHRF